MAASIKRPYRAKSRKQSLGGNGRETGRNQLIAVKGTVATKAKLYALAKRDGLLAAEVLERALEAYEVATR